jgi:peptidyl-tRNA hydrolase
MNVLIERAVYIVMRADLNMSRGKEIAQAVHAINAMTPIDVAEMVKDRLAVICVRADSEDELRLLIAEAVIETCPVAPVVDAGRTVFDQPTLTCVAIGPVEKGALPLLSAARCY